jgi:hypothetical protein
MRNISILIYFFAASKDQNTHFSFPRAPSSPDHFPQTEAQSSPSEKKNPSKLLFNFLPGNNFLTSQNNRKNQKHH